MRVGYLVTSTTVVCIKVSGDMAGTQGFRGQTLWDCCNLHSSECNMQQLTMPFLRWLDLLAYQWHTWWHVAVQPWQSRQKPQTCIVVTTSEAFSSCCRCCHCLAQTPSQQQGQGAGCPASLAAGDRAVGSEVQLPPCNTPYGCLEETRASVGAWRQFEPQHQGYGCTPQPVGVVSVSQSASVHRCLHTSTCLLIFGLAMNALCHASKS